MTRIDKMIEINAQGKLAMFTNKCYKVVKHIVYNGDAKKAYQSFKPLNKKLYGNRTINIYVCSRGSGCST